MTAGFGPTTTPLAFLSPLGGVTRQNGAMRAWLMDSYEGIDKLHLGEVADPQPNQGEVLLAVRFAALNPADAFLAQAQYPAKHALPHILRRDGVGVVRAVNPSETEVRVGDSASNLTYNVGLEASSTLA